MYKSPEIVTACWDLIREAETLAVVASAWVERASTAVIAILGQVGG